MSSRRNFSGTQTSLILECKFRIAVHHDILAQRVNGRHHIEVRESEIRDVDQSGEIELNWDNS